MARTFTLAEAENLLPVLESLLRSAIQAKALIEEVDAEQQSLANRIFINGGTMVDIVAVARRKAEREKALQKAKDAVAEIDATGVQVKDLDIGLLDFPCLVGDEVILLCWKLGEKGITHWHGAGGRLRRPQADRRPHPPRAEEEQLVVIRQRRCNLRNCHHEEGISPTRDLLSARSV